MDRKITHVGQIPLAEDWLQPQQDAMVALGALAHAMFGGEAAVIGLTVGPTQPATMAVTVSPGAIYQLGALEPTAYGVLPVDLTQIIKQGLQNTAVTLPVAAPATAGHSRAYLVQAAFSEEDTDALLLPYFNSANPAQAYSGPNNNGQRQNTRRRGRVIIQMKAGAPSPTGTQVPPSADIGFIGLAIVIVANGAAQVSQGAIQSLQTVPRPPSSLLRLRPGFSEMVAFATPGSTTNWVVPNGVRRVRARVWGGGGGGGSGASGALTPPYAGTGGASGAYAEGIYNVAPGQVIPVTVGAGGSGQIHSGSGATAGGLSSFGSFATALGGGPGALVAVTAANQIGGPSASGGTINMAGGHGGLPFANAASPSSANGGRGGSAPQGGQGGVESYSAPSMGGFPGGGGGGGGGTGAVPGGAGAPGHVILEF